mmetsp:Transcript_39026/g.84298  ORF Transcript_39026/g.84298 Transcript_39026/m.84298 type:complete len:445 (+) Transcript_39026:233-1567(+)
MQLSCDRGHVSFVSEACSISPENAEALLNHCDRDLNKTLAYFDSLVAMRAASEQRLIVPAPVLQPVPFQRMAPLIATAATATTRSATATPSPIPPTTMTRARRHTTVARPPPGPQPVAPTIVPTVTIAPTIITATPIIATPPQRPLESTSTATATTASPAWAAPDELVALGFDRSAAERALLEAHGDANLAYEILASAEGQRPSDLHTPRSPSLHDRHHHRHRQRRHHDQQHLHQHQHDSHRPRSRLPLLGRRGFWGRKRLLWPMRGGAADAEHRLEQENCPICQEAMSANGGAVARCAGTGGVCHHFHAECLGLWVSSRRAENDTPTCPVCRGDLEINGRRLHWHIRSRLMRRPSHRRTRRVRLVLQQMARQVRDADAWSRINWGIVGLWSAATAVGAAIAGALRNARQRGQSADDDHYDDLWPWTPSTPSSSPSTSDDEQEE